jgi:hypothetical protein
MPGDSNIFPLLDRDSPILDRVRGQEEENGVGKDMGKTVAQVAQAEDDEIMAAELERQSELFTKAVAEQLDVEADEVNPDVVERFAGLMMLTESDLTVEGEDEGEDDESDSSFGE